MSDFTTGCSALLPSARACDQRAPAGAHGLVPTIARLMSWIWVQWRRREIIRTLNRVDDHLLRDAGIERSAIEDLVDTLTARRR